MRTSRSAAAALAPLPLAVAASAAAALFRSSLSGLELQPDERRVGSRLVLQQLRVRALLDVLAAGHHCEVSGGV